MVSAAFLTRAICEYCPSGVPSAVGFSMVISAAIPSSSSFLRHRLGTAQRQKILHRRAGAELPGPELLERHRFEARELALIEHDLAHRMHMIGDDDLIHAGEGIGTDETARLDGKAELLHHLAPRRLLRTFLGLEKAGDETVPALGPA